MLLLGYNLSTTYNFTNMVQINNIFGIAVTNSERENVQTLINTSIECILRGSRKCCFANSWTFWSENWSKKARSAKACMHVSCYAGGGIWYQVWSMKPEIEGGRQKTPAPKCIYMSHIPIYSIRKTEPRTHMKYICNIHNICNTHMTYANIHIQHM